MNNNHPNKTRNNFRKPIRKPFKKTHDIGEAKPISKEDAQFIKSMVIDETSQYIVLNKPSGVAVQDGSGVERDIDKLSIAFAYTERKKPKLVHRIDRETSGILILAKNRTSAAFLSEQFANKKAVKSYVAIVSGETPENGIINAPLKRGKINGIDLSLVARPNDKDAQEAETIFETIKTNGKISLVKISPKTGRMHQIRAHFAHIGHPILGDMKYGGLLSVNAIAIKRLMLHAQSLKINTPNGIKTFETSLPDDMPDII